MYWNSVHSYRTTSSQNSRAENFSRITTEPPFSSTAPVATSPPAVWYIGRQSYMRSVGLRVHHAGEGVARQHHAVVVDVGGLGQAGGAGGVDVERVILDGQRRALGGLEAVAGQGVDHAVDLGSEPAAFAMRPDLRLGLQQRPRGGEAFGELGCDHDVLGLDDVDAMGERGADQVGVDQRGDAARAGDADPGCHVFRTVRHQQAYRLALGEALRRGPSAHSGWRARRAPR